MKLFVNWMLNVVFLIASTFGYFGNFWNPSVNSQIELLHSQLKSENYQVDSPTETVVLNLPVIENNSQNSTPIPQDNYPPPGVVTETPQFTETPTPTPIPVQTGTVNLPIVIGAVAIIVVIFFAWFFVGFLPSRNRGKPN